MAKPAQKSEPKPEAPALQEAVQRWEQGDILRSRQLAASVLEQQPSEKDAAIARDLLLRAQTPKVGFILLGIAAVGIIVLLILGVIRSQG